METVGHGKLSHKIELVLLKIIPMLLALCYLSNTILSFIGYDFVIFSYIGGMSLLPMIFLYVSSYVFKYCIYHRMFLYYILVSNIINLLDDNYLLPITDRQLFAVYMITAGIFLFLILHLKLKLCKKH